jgi:adenosylcobyric acid synthase
VHGRIHGTAKARDYQMLKPQLMEAVMTSYQRLCAEADLVIVEGAGSPAEINLRQGDIANMGFAVCAGIPVVLVGDIDRGGVIASMVGTHTILSGQDKDRIKGFIINKFRGDVSLFDEGLAIITRHTGWSSLGVLPWLDAARDLPAEDSVILEKLAMEPHSGRVKIAVPVLPRIANFDDFHPFSGEPGVHLEYVQPGENLPGEADLVILPGSKSTIADLAAFRAQGWEHDIHQHVAKGGKVIGICGGYQMLGQTISDPDGVEGARGKVAGLGLLNIETVLAHEKVVRNSTPVLAENNMQVEGYEIHMGQTDGPDCKRPMILIDGRPDGATSPDGKICGCYLHGLFSCDDYRAHLLKKFGTSTDSGSYRARVEAALDEIAASMETCLDIDEMLKLAAI